MKKLFTILFATLLLSACNRSRVEKLYYPDGSIQMETEMKGDMMHGKFVSYHKNGKKESEIFYIDNEANGIYNKYYYHGTLQETGTYVDGKLKGVYKFFDEKGRLFKEVQYQDNVLNGPMVEYSAGIVKIMGNYKNGAMDGAWSYWDIDGSKIGVADFDNGNGFYRNYYSDGSLAVECEYKDSKRNGSEKFYTPKGELYMEQIFKDDVLVNAINYVVP